MLSIKVKLKENCYESSCFICLKPVSKTYQSNSLKFLFNYLKIKHKLKSIVCGKCDNILTKLAKLSETLEKVSLEMDYLLDSIQSEISSSNYHKQPEPDGFNSVRESVSKKCKKELLNPKPEILLQRIRLPNHTKPPDSALHSTNLEENVFQDNQSSRNIQPENPATPVISEVIVTKLEDAHTAFPPLPNKFLGEDSGYLSASKLNADTHIQRYNQINPGNLADEGQTRSENTLNHQDRTAAVISEISKISIETLKEAAVAFSGGERECGKCHKIFCTKHALKQHINNIHLGLKSFKCPTCSRKFNLVRNLRRHISLVHLRLKEYKCDMCDESFSYFKQLILHKTTVHNFNLQIPKNPKTAKTPKIPKTFACNKCGNIYSTLKSLQTHKLKVHEENIFKCSRCREIFKERNQLKLHISSVHWKKIHYCKVQGCTWSFSCHSELADHCKLEHPDISQNSQTNRECASSDRPCVKSESFFIADEFVLP